MDTRFTTGLVEDKGETAESGDFFRSRLFYEAERVTHSLCLYDGLSVVMALPLIIRSIPGTDLCDGISPYGFPGGSVKTPARVELKTLDWSTTRLVSIFLRNRVGVPPVIADGNVRGYVQIVDPSQTLSVRRNHRCDIKRNTALGYSTEVVPGPATCSKDRKAFREMYWQTMKRQSARPWYFFSEEYFETIMRSDLSWLVLSRDAGGTPAAGIHVVYSDMMLHCYLAGTADDFLKHSPGKNAFMAAIEMAQERMLPLNLGGGMRTGDSLEHFKAGFANSSEPFYTHEIVCDAAAYCLLAQGKSETDFFPIYRSSVT